MAVDLAPLRLNPQLLRQIQGVHQHLGGEITRHEERNGVHIFTINGRTVVSGSFQQQGIPGRSFATAILEGDLAPGADPRAIFTRMGHSLQRAEPRDTGEPRIEHAIIHNQRFGGDLTLHGNDRIRIRPFQDGAHRVFWSDLRDIPEGDRGAYGDRAVEFRRALQLPELSPVLPEPRRGEHGDRRRHAALHRHEGPV